MSKKNPETALLGAAQAELAAQLKVLRARRKELPVGGFDKDLSSAAAALGRAITALSAEQRQQEKHAKEVVTRMTEAELDEVVKTHLASLPVERRAEIRAYLDSLDSVRSVL